MTSSILVLHGAVVDLDRGRVRRGAEEVSLTDTERRLLAHLVAHAGQVVGREALLEQVWGYADGVVSRTVDSAVRRLRSKLGEPGRKPRHLLTVYGGGYRFVPLVDAPTRHRLETPDVSGRGALPAWSSEFVGRADQLEALRVSDARAWLLLGPGGAGKTRLAWEHARACAASFAGGARFCALEDVRTPVELVPALAQALELPQAPGVAPEEAIGRLALALAERPGELVVLDNLEQLDAASEALVGALLQRGGATRWLLTSRRRMLDLPSLRLDGLPLERAATLFAERARQLRPSLSADLAEDPHVRRIVALVDGLPLAVELAAARVRLFAVDALADRLEAQLSSLGRASDGPARHLDIAATVRWSWALLAPDAQAALSALSLFRGGLEVQAAEAVIDRPDALTLLDALLDHSLLQVMPGAARLHVFEVVREVVARVAPPDDAARSRHGAWFTALAREEGARLASPEAGEALTRLRLERPNLDAALARERDPVRAVSLAVAMHPLVRFTRRVGAVLRALEACTPQLDDGQLRGRALAVQADLERFAGRFDRTVSLCDEAIAATSDPRLQAEALLTQAVATMYLGDFEGSLARIERGQRLAEAAGDGRLSALLLGQRAGWMLTRGHFTAAARAHGEAVVALEAAGDLPAAALLRGGRALALCARLENRSAIHQLERTLELLDSMPPTTILAFARTHLAQARHGCGQLEQAEQDARDAVARSRHHGFRQALAVGLCVRGWILAEAERHDEAMGCLHESARLAWTDASWELRRNASWFLAQVELRQGRVDLALEQLGRALEATRPVEAAWVQAPLRALLGALAANAGAVGLASAAQDAAEAAVAGREDVAGVAVVGFFRAWLDMARSRQAPEPDEAQAHRAQARSRVRVLQDPEGAPEGSLLDSSADCRAVLALFRASVRADGGVRLRVTGRQLEEVRRLLMLV